MAESFSLPLKDILDSRPYQIYSAIQTSLSVLITIGGLNKFWLTCIFHRDAKQPRHRPYLTIPVDFCRLHAKYKHHC